MRELTVQQSHDLAELALAFDAVAPLHVTSTMLRKGISDATEAIRRALQASGYHRYAVQPKGQDAKVRRPIEAVAWGAVVDSTLSLYRPETKLGDPRFWLGSAWKQLAVAGDVWAMCPFNEDRMVVVRLATEGTGDAASPDVSHAIRDFAPKRTGSAHAADLLARLRDIARRGPIRSSVVGDTAVGMAVEMALGIDPNSSTGPDYRGAVEIKSGRQRSGAGSRTTIFSKTPDWSRTEFGDRRAVLDAFGVPSASHGGRRRLYNTVRATATNSHGLMLDVDHDADLLHALHVPTDRIAMTWPLEGLRRALVVKHAETFWLSCSARPVGGGEEFELLGIVHTAKPYAWAFGPLVEEGVITLDTTIGERPDGSARDHGWLFRMLKTDVERLVPIVGEYDLVGS